MSSHYWLRAVGSRKPLLARYYVHQLEVAAIEGKVPYREITELNDVAVPRLIDLFRSERAPHERAAKALTEIVLALPDDDPALTKMAAHLAEPFGEFQPAGRSAILAQILEPLLTRCPACKDSCREMVKAALKDADANNRTAAIVLALRRDIGLGAEVVPLLTDRQVEVRRSAMLAIGTSPELIGADDLLHWLHDPDKEVRDLCEAALKSRGLRDKDVPHGQTRDGCVVPEAAGSD